MRKFDDGTARRPADLSADIADPGRLAQISDRIIERGPGIPPFRARSTSRVSRRAASYTPVSGPVLSEMRSTCTPTFSSSVSPRFMNGVCIS